jgi:hypothetical protein
LGQIVVLPTADRALSTPVELTALMAKYQVPLARLLTT